MIRFFYQAGTRATEDALLDAIKSDLAKGGEVLLLVPEQETVSVERRMLHALPPDAQLSFEVVNFSRLANRVFRVMGGHQWHVATPAVRSLLMWRTLHALSPMLSCYGAHADTRRLCDMMLETVSHCRAFGVSHDALLGAAATLEQSDPFRDKLTDLGMVFGAFERALSERFDNGDDDLDRLCELLRQKGAGVFANTHVYVDSFTDFTGQECDILRILMERAASLGITFPLDGPGDAGLHLESATRTHSLLSRMAKELSLPITMHKPAGQKPHTAREYLVRHLFDMNAERAPLSFVESSDVSVTLCHSPFEEARAATAEIHRLVRAGARYRDIAVVVRDTSAWEGILDAALEREGIPFFLSQRTDVTVRPLVKLILLALRIRMHGWRDEDVIAYAKTGLCGIHADDINHLEEYASVWHPRGKAAYAAPFTKNPDGYSTQKSARGERILAGANRAREALFPALDTLFSALEGAASTTEMCRAIYDFLCALHVAEQLKASAAALLAGGERRDAEELARLYTVTTEALESLALALGDEVLSIAQLTEALSLIFARTDIGSIPTSGDEVMIGSASMLRADHPRHVLVLGLCEGEFPRPVTDDGLLSQHERERLSALDVALPANSAERSSDELFYVYRAFCAAGDSLYLSFSTHSASGGSRTPSIAIERTKALLHGLPIRVFAAQEPLDSIYTPEAALDALGDLDPRTRGEVSDLLRAMEIPAARSLSRPVVKQDASIRQDTATALFEHARMSPSHLESFASCRFAYYCDKILRLREEKGGSFALSDTGNFLHYVLEHVLLRLRAQGGKASQDTVDTDTLVREICNAYRRDLTIAGGEMTPRATALFERLSRLATLVVRGLLRELDDSAFIPALTEFDLRRSGGIDTLTLPNGASIPLSGKVDRIDILRAPDGDAYLRVVDYKTGARRFSPSDPANGLSLQMPLYLLALCGEPHPTLNEALGLPVDTVLKPAGVTYLSTAISSEATPSKKDEDAAMQDATERLTRSGVLLDDPFVLHAASFSGDPAIIGSPRSKKTLDEDGFEAMFSDLCDTVSRISGEMKGGLASARPNKHAPRVACEYCQFSAICRVAQKELKGGG